MKKNIFIVTYYWPPAGGPGVQRWLKFVKYLSKDDFDIHVVIPENPDYPSIDDSLMGEIPEDITMIKVHIQEPSRALKKLFGTKTKKLQRGFIEKSPGALEKILLWIRGNMFIPDARKAWADKVMQRLENDSAFAKADTLITTGPPHSVHLTGLWLKNHPSLSHIKWLADFRDPWTTIGYHKDLKLTKAAAKKHLQLETQVLQTADQIIVTSPSTKAEFSNKTKKSITVITNGYDMKTNSSKAPDGKFTLSHIGTLLADRDPLMLWKTLSELVTEDPEFSQDFELQLAGNVSKTVISSIKVAGLGSHLKLLGYVDHDHAVQLMFESQVLLLIEINSLMTKAIIPGKLFEYLASRRPIIGIGPEDSDIEQILKETDAGHYFTYDGANLKQQIRQFYQSYKKEKLEGNSSDISKYHRKQLTQQLVDLLNS
ncbi:glycosyltransferase family protein [Nonlabens marinus]|uniref:TPR/glycosyl transferase domain protein n=1 Tax=Nonlabens marinus S1-08 TaxID=1454201 RepID=W8VRS1_9FLAO|nr:glycosyl transferase family 1 [Nonlabens marinus]BAO56449.1 TPR/glycosyl transferase domain protein [Nonlabens marinus S1-08]